MLNIVGKQIQVLREKRIPHFTQEGLAIQLQILGWNVDRFTISKIERGKRQVTDKELILIAQALDINIAMLFANLEGNEHESANS